jgi:pimeloyl-ACP methyl ester carboxylesterase
MEALPEKRVCDTERGPNDNSGSDVQSDRADEYPGPCRKATHRRAGAPGDPGYVIPAGRDHRPEWRYHLYPWAFVSDRFMLNYLKRIGFNAGSVADEIMPLILNAFRYDVKCFYKYFYEISRNGSLHLNAPLYSIIGDEDPLTGNYRRIYKEWLNYADKVTLKVIPDANHYFIKSHPEQMAKILLEIQEEAVDIAI